MSARNWSNVFATRQQPRRQQMAKAAATYERAAGAVREVRRPREDDGREFGRGPDDRGAA